MKQFYINSAGTLTILCLLMNQYLIPDSFSFDVPLIAPVTASATSYWNYQITSLDLSEKGSYPKHTCTLWTSTYLSVSINSLKIKFKSVRIRHMTVSMQLSAVNNIFKAVLKVIQEIRKFYLESRRKTSKILQYWKRL